MAFEQRPLTLTPDHLVGLSAKGIRATSAEMQMRLQGIWTIASRQTQTMQVTFSAAC